MRGKREKQDRQDRKTGIKVIAHEIQGRSPTGTNGPGRSHERRASRGLNHGAGFRANGDQTPLRWTRRTGCFSPLREGAVPLPHGTCMNFLRQHGIGHAKNPPDSTATWHWGPRSHLRNLNPCHIIVGGPLSKVDSVRIVAYSLAVVAVVRGCRGTGIASQPLSSRRIVCWGRTGEKGREPLCLRSI